VHTHGAIEQIRQVAYISIRTNSFLKPIQEYHMHIRTLIVATGLALASSTAFAFHCPADMKAIDAALPKAKLTDAQMSEVKKYRAEGETQHKAGKHQESVDTLAKARKLLNI
jgi:hypothetical protein